MTYPSLLEPERLFALTRKRPACAISSPGQIHGGVFPAMSGGYRSKLNKSALVAALAVVAFAAILLVGNTTWLQIQYEQEAVEAADYYRDYSTSRISSTCLAPNGQWDAVCVEQASESARQAQRAEYDLYAQRAMSLWTAVMGWMSVVGVGLTGLGVWFIKRTLDATLKAVEDTGIATEAMQRANQIARDMGVAQFRAYLRITGCKLRGSGSSATFGVRLENTGATPASSTSLSVTARLIEGDEIVSEGVTTDQIVGPTEIAAHTPFADFTGSVDFEEAVMEDRTQRHFRTVVRISFVDQFGNNCIDEAEFRQDTTIGDPSDGVHRLWEKRTYENKGSNPTQTG